MANDVVIVVKSKDQASAVFKDIKGNAEGLGGALTKVGQIAGGIVLGAGLLKAPGFLLSASVLIAVERVSG